MAEQIHRVYLKEERRPGGSQTWHRSYCTCGEYNSGLHGSPGRAEAAGRDHANAKNGVR